MNDNKRESVFSVRLTGSENISVRCPDCSKEIIMTFAEIVAAVDNEDLCTISYSVPRP